MQCFHSDVTQGIHQSAAVDPLQTWNDLIVRTIARAVALGEVQRTDAPTESASIGYGFLGVSAVSVVRETAAFIPTQQVSQLKRQSVSR